MKQVLSFVTFILISGVFALPTALDGDVSHQEQAHGRLVAREDWGSPIEAGVQFESQRRSLIPDDQQSEHLALFTKRDDALDQAFATASEQVGAKNVGGAQWFPEMHFSASSLWRRIASSIAAKLTKRDDTSRSNFSRSFGEKSRRDSRSPASKRTSAVSDLEDRSAEPQPANSQVVGDTLVTDFTGSNDSNATTSDDSASTSSGNGSGRSPEALEKDYSSTLLHLTTTKSDGTNVTSAQDFSARAHRKVKSLFGDYSVSDLIGRRKINARDGSGVQINLTAIEESSSFKPAPKKPAAHRSAASLRITNGFGDIIGRSNDAAVARTERRIRRARRNAQPYTKLERREAQDAAPGVGVPGFPSGTGGAPPPPPPPPPAAAAAAGQSPPCGTDPSDPKVATMHMYAKNQNENDLKGNNATDAACSPAFAGAGTGGGSAAGPVLVTGT